MQKVENWTRLGHIYADCSVLAGNMMLMTFDKNKKVLIAYQPGYDRLCNSKIIFLN